jgi:hypothetical protein
MERLHSLATRAQPPLSRASVFLMGAVAEDSRREAAELLVRARSRVKVLRGEEWQRLSLVLERLGMADEPRTDGAVGLPVTPLNGPAHVGAVAAGPGSAEPEPGAGQPGPTDDLSTGLA